MFDPVAWGDYPSDLQSLFPEYDGYSSGCQRTTLKYAEWCGSGDVAIMTMFCTNAKGELLASRVVLVLGDPPQYHDLTRDVEELWPSAARPGHGGIRGFTATCRVAE
jgi:hypothetical protein